MRYSSSTQYQIKVRIQQKQYEWPGGSGTDMEREPNLEEGWGG